MPDFEQFEKLFLQKHEELKSGVSKLVPFGGEPTIEPGSFFVLAGVMLFIAEIGEEQSVPGIRTRYKRRTRTIFENVTESSLFRRSLAGQLYEHGGFKVVPSAHTELLADDEETGYIYVLRSLSDDPQIASVRDLHKIGFSRGPVEKRVAHATSEPTYLMAPVEIVRSYRTYNLRTSALEAFLHRVFAEVRLAATQVGLDGRTYEPSEWYSVPLAVIDEAIDLIVSGEIVSVQYNPHTQSLEERGE